MESSPSKKRSRSPQENDKELDTAHCNENLWACQLTVLKGSHYPSLLPTITNMEKCLSIHYHILHASLSAGTAQL